MSPLTLCHTWDSNLLCSNPVATPCAGTLRTIAFTIYKTIDLRWSELVKKVKNRDIRHYFHLNNIPNKRFRLGPVYKLYFQNGPSLFKLFQAYYYVTTGQMTLRFEIFWRETAN